MSLYDDIMSICDRQMACSDVFCPYLACSFASHIFNLHNQTAKILGVLSPRNVKVNIIIISPSGLSKNESIRRFTDQETGILKSLDGKIDMLPNGVRPDFTHFSGEITAAGLVGTLGKDEEEIYGDAYIYRKGILSFGELASLFNKSDHSKDLMNHVLRILGDNQIIKRLAKGEIAHNTYVTLWGGLQPSRIMYMDNTGIERRALYLFHEWTSTEINEMISFRTKETTLEEIEILHMDLASIRTDILSFVDDVKHIKKIVWHLDRKQFAKMPADVDIIEGLAVGYALLTQPFVDTLEVVPDPKLIQMLTTTIKMKNDLKQYENLIMGILTLSSQGQISTSDFYKKHMKYYGYTYSQTMDILQKAYSLDFIEKVRIKNKTVLWKLKEAM